MNRILALVALVCACAYAQWQFPPAAGGGSVVSAPPVTFSAETSKVVAYATHKLDVSAVAAPCVPTAGGTVVFASVVAAADDATPSKFKFTLTPSGSAYTGTCYMVAYIGATGPQGPQGPAGATWLSGSGAPSGGSDGDMYLNTTSGDVFRKSSGSWGTAIANLKGVKGDAGQAGAPGQVGNDGVSPTFRSGSGVPAAGLGVNGDVYLNTATGDVYAKSAGSWGSAIANLKGGKGDTGNVSSAGGLNIDGPGTGFNALWDDAHTYFSLLTAAPTMTGNNCFALPTGPATTTNVSLGVVGLTPNYSCRNSGLGTLHQLGYIAGGGAPKVVAYADTATITIDSALTDVAKIAALSQDTTIANPTGTPSDGQVLTIRMVTASSRALTFGTAFRAGYDLPLPTYTTGAGKLDYMRFLWNADASKWDYVSKIAGF